MKNTLYIIFFFICITTSAQQLIYSPTNSAFGGNSYNYSWLLSSATAQNQFKDSGSNTRLNDLNSFSQSLNRQLMSQLSRNIMGDVFEDGNLTPGTYTYGSLYLEITQSGTGLVINILDTNTGEQTEIVVPD